VQFNAVAQSANCANLRYGWFLPDGSIVQSPNASFKFTTPGTYKVSVKVECDECNTAATVKEVTVNVVDFWIDACGNPNDCDLTGSNPPQMPQIKVKAHFDGLDPAIAASTTITWTANVKFHAGECNPGTFDEIEDLDPITQNVTGTDWTIPFSSGPTLVRGGHLKLAANAIVQGHKLSASTDDKPATTDLYIRGTNPLRSDVAAVLKQDPVLLQIACQESTVHHVLGQRQFEADQDGGRDRCMIFNTRGDNGVGMMQITPPRSTADVWNWVTNGQDGYNIFYNEKRPVAVAYPGRIQSPGSTRWEQLQNAYNAQRRQSNLPPIAITLAPFSPTQITNDTIRGYNGWLGDDGFPITVCKNGTCTTLHPVLHEYRVLLNAQGLLVVNVDPSGRTGIAQWDSNEIPYTDRPQGIGDPDYVRHVLGHDTGCTH